MDVQIFLFSNSFLQLVQVAAVAKSDVNNYVLCLFNALGKADGEVRGGLHVVPAHVLPQHRPQELHPDPEHLQDSQQTRSDLLF